jgi:hypothetical protein
MFESPVSSQRCSSEAMQQGEHQMFVLLIAIALGMLVAAAAIGLSRRGG